MGFNMKTADLFDYLFLEFIKTILLMRTIGYYIIFIPLRSLSTCRQGALAEWVRSLELSFCLILPILQQPRQAGAFA